MLSPGDRIPDARIWTAPRERVPLREHLAGVPALLLFYLFDWSST
jgi:hypothetical protein